MIYPADHAHPIVSLLSALQAAIKRGDTDEIQALRALIAQATRHPPLWRVFFVSDCSIESRRPEK